jgi:hypothetical protein
LPLGTVKSHIARGAASPWLIQCSALLSQVLDQAFALVSEWLAKPAGMAIGAIAGVLLAVLDRVRTWRARR